MNHSSSAPRAARRRSAVTVLAALIACGVALVGCSSPAAAPTDVPTPSDTTAAEQMLAEHDLAGLDVAEVIERLEALPLADRPTDLIASVRPDALVLDDGRGQEARIPMPADVVYVSVAPFLEQTHECHFHSLTTCIGELGGADIRIVLTTDAGEVLINEARRTSDNGFTGLWVPRGVDATLTVEHDGRTGSAPVSTIDVDDATCITTLQLL